MREESTGADESEDCLPCMRQLWEPLPKGSRHTEPPSVDSSTVDMVQNDRSVGVRTLTSSTADAETVSLLLLLLKVHQACCSCCIGACACSSCCICTCCCRIASCCCCKASPCCITSHPWRRVALRAISTATMSNDSFLGQLNEIVVTTRSRSAAQALVDCGECQQVTTPPLGLCPLGHVHSTSTPPLRKKNANQKMASLRRRFNASSASRLRFVWQPFSLVSLLLPVAARRPDQKLVLLLPPLLLLLASCALLPFLPSSFPRAPCATCSLVTTSSRRRRTSSPSRRSASYHPARRQLRHHFLCRACRLLLQPLCSCCVILPPLFPRRSGFPSRVGHCAGRFVPSRSSHFPPRARLIPRGHQIPCHFCHLGSFSLLLILTDICPPTPRVISSIPHPDSPFVKRSAKCCSPATASSSLFLIWSPPAAMSIAIQYVWCLSKSSAQRHHFGCV